MLNERPLEFTWQNVRLCDSQVCNSYSHFLLILVVFFCCPIFFHFVSLLCVPALCPCFVSLLCVLHYWSVFHFSFQFVNCCPRRDFAFWAKSRGGTLVTRAYIKESTYSWNIQSYSQYRKTLDLLEQGPRGIGRKWWRFYCLRPQVRNG